MNYSEAPINGYPKKRTPLITFHQRRSNGGHEYLFGGHQVFMPAKNGVRVLIFKSEYLHWLAKKNPNMFVSCSVSIIIADVGVILGHPSPPPPPTFSPSRRLPPGHVPLGHPPWIFAPGYPPPLDICPLDSPRPPRTFAPWTLSSTKYYLR